MPDAAAGSIGSDIRRKYAEYVMTGVVQEVAPVVVERATGALVYDVDGREYLDCFAGISVVNAGHCNPEVVAAAKQQADKLVHCCAYAYHSPPTADLAEKLAEITPGRLKKTFFSNSGAEAVEGALKLARLYTGRREFVALDTAFHGRTFGSLSVTGNAARKRGGPFLAGVAFAPVPYSYRMDASSEDECVEKCVRGLEEALRFRSSGDVAAFIAEPVLGEGGILVPPRRYFKAIKPILDRHNMLFIADEVQSGFGRCGTMFAIEQYDVEPDILVMAKGIADGFPLGAMIARDEVAAAFKPGDHLSTFGGNPVSSAAALANIAYLQREKLPQRARELGGWAVSELKRLQQRYSLIGDVRGAGLMIGVELVEDPNTKTPAQSKAGQLKAECLKRGLLIGVGGVYGNVLRLQPPLVITRAQMERALSTLEDALKAVS
jgi:4-aminobutyrate aminotransferase